MLFGEVRSGEWIYTETKVRKTLGKYDVFGTFFFIGCNRFLKAIENLWIGEIFSIFIRNSERVL